MQPQKVELDEKTDVCVRNPEIGEAPVGEQLVDKIKKVFMQDVPNEQTVQETLAGFGLQDKLIQKYAPEIEAGKILIVAESELKMGHDSADQHHALNEPIRLRN